MFGLEGRRLGGMDGSHLNGFLEEGDRQCPRPPERQKQAKRQRSRKQILVHCKEDLALCRAAQPCKEEASDVGRWRRGSRARSGWTADPAATPNQSRSSLVQLKASLS